MERSRLGTYWGAGVAVGMALFAWAAPAGGQETAPASVAGDPNGNGVGIAITRPGTFEIHVQGADLRGVLQLLSTQGKRNIIATKEVQGTVTADLYGVTFEQALRAVLASSGYEYLEEDGFIYVYTPDQKDSVLKSRVEPKVRIFHLSYLTAADAQALVAPALSAMGTVSVSPASAVGIGSSSSETGGNAFAAEDVLVVKDAPQNLDEVAKLLGELDVKPDQVLVETTLLSAELREGNKLGVNMNALKGPNWQDIGDTEAALSGPSAFTPGPLDPAVNKSAINFRTDFNPVAGGMSFGVYGSDVAFFITALETVTDVTVLANPKLLVVNKQRGEVIVGRRDGYITTTLTETTATQSVEFLETGTRLLVRPFIARDGYIRMEIHPEDSDGSVEASLPSETTTEVTSNVLVRDGHTIVIGGLFRENTSNGNSQIPGIGNIPYLGSLFRTTDDGTERDEVIVLITPHIINHPEDEAVSARMKDDVERYRIGQRKGIAWWANERLADAQLRAAKRALRDGDRDRALWHVDQALTMRPRLLEAIKLKERLTQQAYWAESPRHSSVRYAIERMIMEDLGRPASELMPPDRPRDVMKMAPEVRKATGRRPEVLAPLPGPAQRPNELEPVDAPVPTHQETVPVVEPVGDQSSAERPDDEDGDLAPVVAEPDVVEPVDAPASAE